MKKDRQKVLLDLIDSVEIDTQESLLEHMRKLGYKLTQATISRDISELNIHKIRTSKGEYRYVSSLNDNKFKNIISSTTVSVASAQNIVVVKCYTGMANAACQVFDEEEIKGIIGTLSGDDTFIAIAENNETARIVENKIKSIITR